MASYISRAKTRSLRIRETVGRTAISKSRCILGFRLMGWALTLPEGKQLKTWTAPFEVITRDTGLLSCLTFNGSKMESLISRRLRFNSPLVTSSDDFPSDRRAALILVTKPQSFANEEGVPFVLLRADDTVCAEGVDLILLIPFDGLSVDMVGCSGNGA